MNESLRILIPDADTFDALKVMRCLSGWERCRVDVISREREAIAQYSRYCSSSSRCYGLSDVMWLEYVRRVVRSTQPDVLFPVTEKAIQLMALHRDAFSSETTLVPLPSPQSMQLTQNKHAFLRFASERGLSVPPSLSLGETLNGDGMANGLLFPAVLKAAVHTGGGRGITCVSSPEALRRTVRARNLPEASWSEWVVQPFVSGTDVCVQLLAFHGEVLGVVVQSGVNVVSDYFGPQRIMEVDTEPAAVGVARDVTRPPAARAALWRATRKMRAVSLR